MPADVNLRLADGQVAHDLLRDTICVIIGLRKHNSVFQAGDDLISPEADVLIRQFLGGEAERHPELRLLETAVFEGKLEAARHDSDDRVGTGGREQEGAAENVAIAVITRLPQGVTDNSEGLARIFFLLRKHAAEDGLDAECWKNAGCEAGGVYFFRGCAAGEFVAGGNVSAL